jgi:hypothetical protein
MQHLPSAFLTVTLCVAGFGSAAAQQQAGFSRWTAPPLAVTARHAPTLTLPDSVRQKVGYQHWKGAAIGAGVGAVLGSVLAFGLAGQCDDCTQTTWHRTRGALVITGASSAFGFLVGLASPKYAWRPSPEQ